MPSTWFLVPGFGAQGATAADTAGAFDGRGLGAIVNSSRAILYAPREPRYQGTGGNWQAAVESATRDAMQQLRADTPAGRL
jgi:orotidine-5'-phosphate decarboxylase